MTKGYEGMLKQLNQKHYSLSIQERKRIRQVCGLTNMLLRTGDSIMIFINGKLIPDCWQIILDGDYVTFCFSDELNIDSHYLHRMHMFIDSIHDITLWKDGELL